MITIILMEPEHPGNVGAVARVMKNFGFFDLILINTKTDIVTEDTRCRAKHAQDVVDKIRFESIDVLKEFDLVVGTTARTGSDYNLSRVPLSPEQLSEKIDDRKIGILFGREGKGLFNEEVKLCDLIVTIPANKEYPVLNLSHSVAVMLYELSKKSIVPRQVEIANREYLDYITKQLDEIFEKLDFTADSKVETQQKAWKRIIAKSDLSKREAFAIFGFLKKLNEKL